MQGRTDQAVIVHGLDVLELAGLDPLEQAVQAGRYDGTHGR